MEEDKKERCEKCGSAFGYVSLRKKMFICRQCGHETKIREGKDADAI